MSGFGLRDDRLDRCTVRPTALSPVHGHNVNRSASPAPCASTDYMVGYIQDAYVLTIGSEYADSEYVI